MRIILFAFAALLAGCADLPTRASAAESAALAPTGKLRVGVYLGNPLSVVRDPKTQELKGAGYELGRELAHRLDVAFEPVIHPSVGAVIASIGSDAWDIAVLVVSPERAKLVDFTAPFAEVELGYLVPADSSLKTAAEIDRSQIRIAAAAKGQADVLLSRMLKNASLVRANGLAEVVQLIRTGKADAAAANKPILHDLASQLPGSRVLDGRFAVERVAFILPKGREAGVAYVNRFIEAARNGGLLHATIQKAGARGALVPTSN